MPSAFQELKQAAFEANLEIPKRGLAIYTFGNVSAFDPARAVLAIKPSGVDYDTLTVADMVVVDLEGRVVEGGLKPSSDTKTHIVLYRAYPGSGRHRPHPFHLRHRLGAGPAADPAPGHHPRRSSGGGCPLHRAHG